MLSNIPNGTVIVQKLTRPVITYILDAHDS